jgi:hypothetical protein
MSDPESNLTPAQKKKRDRAIWLIYAFMVVLILLPLVLFAFRHIR